MTVLNLVCSSLPLVRSPWSIYTIFWFLVFSLTSLLSSLFKPAISDYFAAISLSRLSLTSNWSESSLDLLLRLLSLFCSFYSRILISFLNFSTVSLDLIPSISNFWILSFRLFSLSFRLEIEVVAAANWLSRSTLTLSRYCTFLLHRSVLWWIFLLWTAIPSCSCWYPNLAYLLYPKDLQLWSVPPQAAELISQFNSFAYPVQVC